MNAVRRSISAQHHLSAKVTSQYQGMASNRGQSLQLASRYEMNSGYGIPVLGYGVRLLTYLLPRLLDHSLWAHMSYHCRIYNIRHIC